MYRLLLPLIALGILVMGCGSDNDAQTITGSPDPTPEPTDTGDPVDADLYPIADLSVEVRVDGTDGTLISYHLSCLGDTATLTGDPTPGSAESMCLALDQDSVRSRLIDGGPTDRLCTEIYGGPALAHITGTLDSEAVDTTINRTDGCGIDDWDRLLVAFTTPVG